MDDKSGALSFGQVGDLIDVLPDGVALVDRNGRFLYANQRMETLSGYSRQQLSELLVEDLVPATLHDEHRHHRSEFWDRPRTREMGANLNLRLRCRDGTVLPVDIFLGPLPDGSAVVIAVRDATNREIGEQARRRQAVMGDRSRISRQLQGDIITQLFAIGLTLQLLATRESDAGVKAQIETAVASTDRMIRELREIVFEYTDPYQR